MGSVTNQRRYYLRKAQFAMLFQTERDSIARVYWAKHDALAGTPLPLSVPYQQKLALARYTAIEDFEGADVAELSSKDAGGLTRFEAAAVLAALGATT